jgi:hypothetical protein
MDVALMYGAYLVLVAIASIVLFGLYVVVVIIQEAVRKVREAFSRVLPQTIPGIRAISSSWARDPLCAQAVRLFIQRARKLRRAILRLNKSSSPGFCLWKTVDAKGGPRSAVRWGKE